MNFVDFTYLLIGISVPLIFLVLIVKPNTANLTQLSLTLSLLLGSLLSGVVFLISNGFREGPSKDLIYIISAVNLGIIGIASLLFKIWYCGSFLFAFTVGIILFLITTFGYIGICSIDNFFSFISTALLIAFPLFIIFLALVGRYNV